MCVSTTRATLLAYLQDLHKQVLLGHGSKCITACKALEAQRMAQDASSAGAPDALRTMMDLSQATTSLQKATTCSRVRGRGPAYGTVSRGSYLDVPNCARKKLTVWKEDRFTVTKEGGIEKRKKRVAEMVVREVTNAKQGVWGCVQARELWSTEEDVHLRPGHHWIFEFGDAG